VEKIRNSTFHIFILLVLDVLFLTLRIVWESFIPKVMNESLLNILKRLRV